MAPRPAGPRLSIRSFAAFFFLFHAPAALVLRAFTVLVSACPSSRPPSHDSQQKQRIKGRPEPEA